jgi:hypothetical protein
MLQTLGVLTNYMLKLEEIPSIFLRLWMIKLDSGLRSKSQTQNTHPISDHCLEMRKKSHTKDLTLS